MIDERPKTSTNSFRPSFPWHRGILTKEPASIGSAAERRLRNVRANDRRTQVSPLKSSRSVGARCRIEGSSFVLVSGKVLSAKNWIGGEWVDSSTRLNSINPATGEVIGTYADGSADEANRAIAIARKAFLETPWRGDRRLRARAINEMADRFEDRTGELIEMLSLENGKVKAEARFEVEMVPKKLRFAAALTLTEFGRAIEVEPRRFSTVLKEPMGVVGIVAPWNSPVVLFIRSLGPALAAGCTVVGELPGWTAQTNALMCEIFASVKRLPIGVLNVFSGLHSGGVRVMIDHPLVPTISNTGGSKVGQEISAAGANNLKRFGLELGGKTPVLLFEDANLDKALPVVEKALTVFAGQFCMTGSRLLVQRSILNEVRQRLAKRLEAVRAGPAADPASDMGPMINLDAVRRVDKIVEDALMSGAKSVVRGGPFEDGPLAKGAFYRPTFWRSPATTFRSPKTRCSVPFWSCRPSTTRRRRSRSPTIRCTG
jgi:betaine-aldehyde dehydrogenase